MENFPTLVGMSRLLGGQPSASGSDTLKALHEIHLFMSAPNPSKEILELYQKLVNQWNEKHSSEYQKNFGLYSMKACFLCLIFRNKDGSDNPVNVMQTAIYCQSDSTKEVFNEMKKQVKFFEDSGLKVIREKIEASAYGIKGIPQDQNSEDKYYFEFHIKIASPNEIDTLKTISEKLTVEFNAPVPLSYNIFKHQTVGDEKGGQRFLNVRFRGLGMKQISPKLTHITKLIESYGLKVEKRISEYVWYDTAPEIDKGWIDFAPDEELNLIEFLKQKNEKILN